MSAVEFLLKIFFKCCINIFYGNHHLREFLGGCRMGISQIRTSQEYNIQHCTTKYCKEFMLSSILIPFWVLLLYVRRRIFNSLNAWYNLYYYPIIIHGVVMLLLYNIHTIILSFENIQPPTIVDKLGIVISSPYRPTFEEIL